MGQSMRHISVLVALVATGIGGCNAAPEVVTACSKAMSERLSLNAFELFDGANQCGLEERHSDANKLMLTGQVRAMTDMTVLRPLNEEDEKIAADLYALIYATYGGIGYDEPYANKAESDALFATLRQTPITFSPAYDPGWTYHGASKIALYDGVAYDQLASRLWSVEYIAKQLQIPKYLEAHRAYNLFAFGQGAILVDSPETDEMGRLRKIMNDASKGIEQGPPPEATVAAYEFYDFPENEDFRQIASGLNGPENPRYDLFKSADDVRTSWVADFIQARELNRLLESIDFPNETLGAQATGKRVRLSGNIYVTDFSYNEAYQSYSMNVAVGMLSEDCTAPKTDGQPFVLAVTKGGAITGSSGRGSNNFPDKCPE